MSVSPESREIGGGSVQRTLADLLDLKRRALGDHLAVGDQLVRSLAGMGEQTVEAEDLVPAIDQRDRILSEVRKLDRAIAATPSTDSAAEIVAENAMGRALSAVAEQDLVIAEFMGAWNARLVAGLAEIGAGKKTLKAYSRLGASRTTLIDRSG